jgi:hypothetical protein
MGVMSDVKLEDEPTLFRKKATLMRLLEGME